MKIFAAFILSLFIASCGSNPSKDNKPIEVKQLSFQELSDNGLYSKEDDANGLYGIEFYEVKGSSISQKESINEVTDKAKKYCGFKESSEYFGSTQIKPKPLGLRFKFEEAWVYDTSLIFICRDIQFTKNNENLLKRLKDIAAKEKTRVIEWQKEYLAEKKRKSEASRKMWKKVHEAGNKLYEEQGRISNEYYKKLQDIYKQPEEYECKYKGYGNKFKCKKD